MHLTRRQRRRDTLQFKRQAIADAVAPGASVSAVALQYGINANLLRSWIKQHLTDLPAADLMPATS